MPESESSMKVRGADFSASELSRILKEAPAFSDLLSEAERQLFEAYAAELIETNKKLNLTAITKADALAYLHFLDSLMLIPLIEKLPIAVKENLSLTDVGSGAGFPGIPVKIMRPQWNVFLMDALNKRVRFLNDVIAKLGLTEISAVHVRAEEAGHLAQYREQSDIVTARAVAALEILAEFCLPLTKVGGYFIAMKATLAEAELAAADPVIKKLGGKIVSIERFTLPFEEQQRSLIVLEKRQTCPPGYPRNYAKIKQKA